MVQPVTTAARIGKWGAVTSARFGAQRKLFRNHVHLSCLPDLARLFDGNVEACAYFTGTAGPHRKTVIQFTGTQGRVLGYAKLSRDPTVREYIGKEATVLNAVRALGLRTCKLPTVIAHYSDTQKGILVTSAEPASSQSSRRVLTKQHRAFLAELSQSTQRAGAQGLLARLESHLPRFDQPWRRRFEHVIDVVSPYAETMPVCIAHGDFTPWNTRVLPKQLYVFDWEYAEPHYPVGFDHLHFLLSANAGSARPIRLRRAVTEISKSYFDANLRFAARSILLSLALHAAFNLRRISRHPGQSEGWPEEADRGALIDQMLECIP